MIIRISSIEATRRFMKNPWYSSDMQAFWSTLLHGAKPAWPGDRRGMGVSQANILPGHSGVSSWIRGVLTLVVTNNIWTHLLRTLQFILSGGDVQGLDFWPGPRRAAEKFKTGIHSGIIVETFDFDPLPQLFPAITINEIVDYLLQGHPMQEVVSLSVSHVRAVLSFYGKWATEGLVTHSLKPLRINH